MVLAARQPAGEVQNHLAALAASSQLTQRYRRTYRPESAMVTPEEVVQALHQAGVRCVLMGTHGLGGYRSEPRATQDVDVLVRKKDLGKAVRALREAFPGLRTADFPVVTRFIDPATGKQVIDLLKPAEKVLRLVFRHTIAVGDSHAIPDLEMALAAKFAAMVSPHRAPEKKMTDAGDFMDVIKHNRKTIDLPKLRRLAEAVYPGGGAEIGNMVADIDAGRIIQL